MSYLARFCRMLLWSACALPLAGCGQEAPPTDPALDALAKSAAPSLPAVFQGRDLAAWLVVAESKDAHERAMAAWAFAELGHASPEIDAPLARLVSDGEASVRRAAFHAIDRLARVPAVAWSGIIAVMGSGSDRDRTDTRSLLRAHGPPPLDELEDFIEWHSLDDMPLPGKLPPAVFEAYVNHPERGERNLPVKLLSELAMFSAPNSEAAVGLLTAHGAAGVQAIQDLIRGQLVGGPAAKALADVGAWKALLELLRSEKPKVQYWAARGLGWMGEAAAPAAKDLLVVVAQEAVAPRQGAIEALVSIGKAARPAINKWIDAQPNDATGTRLRTLGQMMLIRIGD